MAGLDPAIHQLRKKLFCRERWMRGSSPRMTEFLFSVIARGKRLSSKKFGISTERMAGLRLK